MKPAKVNLASNLPSPAPPSAATAHRLKPSRPRQCTDSKHRPEEARTTPRHPSTSHRRVNALYSECCAGTCAVQSGAHNWVVTSYRMKNSDAPCAQLLVLPPCPWYVSVSGGRFLLFLSLFDPMQPRFRAGVILLRLLCFIVFSRVSAERGWPRWDRKTGRILTCQ